MVFDSFVCSQNIFFVDVFCRGKTTGGCVANEAPEKPRLLNYPEYQHIIYTFSKIIEKTINKYYPIIIL